LVDGIKRVVEQLGKWGIELCKESGSGDFGGNLEKEGRGDCFELQKSAQI
jgi:hypothetical protein